MNKEINIIVNKFTEALKELGYDKEHEDVQLLIIQLGNHSHNFLLKNSTMTLDDYKKKCMESIKDHRDGHHELHHKKTSGIFERITNAVMALFSLLEKKFNHMTGRTSIRFHQPDSSSELGKATKAFENALGELKDNRPNPTVSV